MLLKHAALKWKDHEARGRGIILSKGIISVLTIVTAAFLLAMVLQPQYLTRYIIIVISVWFMSAFFLLSMKEENARLVATGYICMLLIMIVFFSWSGGGIKGHGISLLPLVVAFAGLAVGRKQIWFFSIAAAVGGLLLTVAFYSDLLPTKEPLGSSPLIYWLYSVTSIFAITYIEFLSVNRLQKALDETKKELYLRRASEEKYKRIVDSFQDIYYQTDMEGKMTMITPSIKTRAGYETAEVIGRNVRDFYTDPVKREAFLELLRTSGSVYNYDLDLVSKDGTINNVIASSRILYGANGKAIGIEGTLHDITQRKKYENDLKLKNEGLIEIAFLQSHIVRSPVANILGLINLINKNDPADPINAEVLPQLEIAAKQLDGVVHQIVQKTNEIRSSVENRTDANISSL
jgi:PAS domain S-box-containing protein